MKIQGGFTNYGEPIGIIMTDSVLPRIPGDVGNASTFRFPVRYKVVKGALFSRVRNGDPSLIKPFVEAAQELEKEGVKAIATGCGFLAAYHQELIQSVHIPVYSSSLLQIHLAHMIIRPEQKVGIITASKESLSEKQFRGVGIQDIPMVIVGMEESQEFCYTIYDHHPEMDVEQVAEDVVSISRHLVTEHPEVGAIVLECTNLPPYAKRIQAAVHLPIFDVTTLINYAYLSTIRKTFVGIV